MNHTSPGYRHAATPINTNYLSVRTSFDWYKMVIRNRRSTSMLRLAMLRLLQSCLATIKTWETLLSPLFHLFWPDPFDSYGDEFHRIDWTVASNRAMIDSRNDIPPFHHHAEYGVLTVPDAHRIRSDEKLTATRVRRAGVSHSQLASVIEPQTGQKLLGNPAA